MFFCHTSDAATAKYQVKSPMWIRFYPPGERHAPIKQLAAVLSVLVRARTCERETAKASITRVLHVLASRVPRNASLAGVLALRTNFLRARVRAPISHNFVWNWCGEARHVLRLARSVQPSNIYIFISQYILPTLFSVTRCNECSKFMKT